MSSTRGRTFADLQATLNNTLVNDLEGLKAIYRDIIHPATVLNGSQRDALVYQVTGMMYKGLGPTLKNERAVKVLKRCPSPPLRTPAGVMPLAQLKQHTERADRASAVLNKKYPNGLGGVMERLKRESE